MLSGDHMNVVFLCFSRDGNYLLGYSRKRRRIGDLQYKTVLCLEFFRFRFHAELVKVAEIELFDPVSTCSEGSSSGGGGASSDFGFGSRSNSVGSMLLRLLLAVVRASLLRTALVLMTKKTIGRGLLPRTSTCNCAWPNPPTDPVSVSFFVAPATDLTCCAQW
jgi:hypothetical protein